MLEIVASEWHISPLEILNEWTDEFFWLMLQKLSYRLKRQNEAYKTDSESGDGGSNPRDYGHKRVPQAEMFRQLDIEVLKNGDRVR